MFFCKRNLLGSLLILYSMCCIAQSNITVKYIGLTFHPFGDKTAYLQPHRLDNTAHFVMNYGSIIGYEHYIYQDFVSVKITQAILTDCAASLTNATHIGIRGTVYDKGKHHLILGIGPMFYARESWARFPEYDTKGSSFYNYKSKLFGDIQWRFFLYTPEIEYNYRISNKLDISFTVLPGVVYASSMAIGLKYWINKDFKIENKFAKPDNN